MPRNDVARLEPDQCWCLSCGQRYFMEIENIMKWQLDQWDQKWEMVNNEP